MNDAELDELLSDIESDLVERKASLANKDRIGEAICAFANDLPNHQRPGILFVGVNDDGTPAGIEVTDGLLRELSAFRSDGNLLPFPAMTVEKRILRGREVAVATVWPSDAPPVKYRGRTWIRVGPRRALASAEEERRLIEKRRARDLPFDARPLPSATLDDLDLERFNDEYLPAALPADVLAVNERGVAEQLAALRLVSADGFPTAAGVLTLGYDPSALLPGAYVQFLRLDGVDLAAPIKDQKRLGGPLTQLLGLVEDAIRVHIEVMTDITGGPVEVGHADYPVAGLQQLFRNAVLHRDYETSNAPVRINWFDDRLEILSPGGPYGQVTIERFGEPGVTDYRNPTLAEAMKALGFVQKFGVGIPLARAELNRNGNPPLEFQVNESNVLAIVRRRP